MPTLLSAIMDHATRPRVLEYLAQHGDPYLAQATDLFKPDGWTPGGVRVMGDWLEERGAPSSQLIRDIVEQRQPPHLIGYHDGQVSPLGRTYRQRPVSLGDEVDPWFDAPLEDGVDFTGSRIRFLDDGGGEYIPNWMPWNDSASSSPFRDVSYGWSGESPVPGINVPTHVGMWLRNPNTRF